MDNIALLALYEAIRTVFFNAKVVVDPTAILAMEKDTLLQYATALRKAAPVAEQTELPFVGLFRDKTAYCPVYFSVGETEEGFHDHRSEITFGKEDPSDECQSIRLEMRDEFPHYDLITEIVNKVNGELVDDNGIKMRLNEIKQTLVPALHYEKLRAVNYLIDSL